MRQITIHDPTLRDGNHAVSHQLTLENIANYCKIAEAAGVPVIEVGHGNGLGASSILIGQSLVDDEFIIKAARVQLKNTKLSMHVIPGFATIKKDIVLAIDLGVDIFRIGTHVTEADISKRHIEYVRSRGLTAMGVLMMSHMASIKQLVSEAKKMQSYGAQALVIMDSSGHYLSVDVIARISALKDSLEIPVGFHGHNNLGMAIANSLAAVESGAEILDASIRGFGAGAGNTQLEILVAVLERMKYQTNINLHKILDAADLAEKTFNPIPAFSTTLSIVSGLAGVFSGFAKHVKSVSKDFNVDEKDVFFELGRRGVISGQESIIYEVAQNLAAKKIKEEYHGF
jgi:4-hydroxy 2-oxovalerate aldolase